MRLLDLFCGVGGSATGYFRAGYDEIVGVDTVPQPEYPFSFELGDALTYPLDGFDAIHASPPCKRFTVAGAKARRAETLFEPHPDLLTPTLERLGAVTVPWVVENVPGAPLRPDLLLCGSMFGLEVRRHRLFQSNAVLSQPACRHDEQPRVVGVYGDGGGDPNRARRGGGGGVKVAGAEAAAALGIDWTTRQRSLSQAIPPAYTEYVGAQLLAAVTA